MQAGQASSPRTHCNIGGLSVGPDSVFMAALWNRAGHYIFAQWFLSSFFPHLISVAADWMSTILLHTVWP